MESTEHLDKLINHLDNFKDEFVSSSIRFLEAGNKSIYTLDLFASSVNNRAISLTNAFATLARINNYLAAVSLIRLQLDNALRFFASTLVKDSNDFVLHYIQGNAIRDYQDINGKNLTDTYLTKQLEKKFKGIIKLYKDASGYVHLSERHFMPAVKTNEDYKIEVKIGNYDTYNLAEKIDFTKTMIEVSKLVLIIIEQWKHEKDRLGTL